MRFIVSYIALLYVYIHKVKDKPIRFKYIKINQTQNPHDPYFVRLSHKHLRSTPPKKRTVGFSGIYFFVHGFYFFLINCSSHGCKSSANISEIRVFRGDRSSEQGHLGFFVVYRKLILPSDTHTPRKTNMSPKK